MSKPRLIIVGPLPPPIHGVTVSTGLVLANGLLADAFEIRHLDTSDHRDGRNVGRWDFTNVRIGVRNVAHLARMLRGRRGLIYLPLSQSRGAFMRDSLFILLAVVARWRVAIHLRGSEFIPLYDHSNRIFRAWVRRTLNRVASAAVMGETLRDAFGSLIPQGRVVVVPNGTPPMTVDATKVNPSQVLFLSNLRRRKGVIEAVEAALLVLERVPEARFVFAGAWEDDELRNQLIALCHERMDRIEFRPGVPQQEKEQLLCTSAVLLFPPREPEGHPRVVLEAIAAGLPVVATDRGAIAETIEHGVSGFVVADSDPVVLADRVTQLLQDAEVRHRMSVAALERYHGRFTQHHADQRLADWLIEVSRQVA